MSAGHHDNGPGTAEAVSSTDQPATTTRAATPTAETCEAEAVEVERQAAADRWTAGQRETGERREQERAELAREFRITTTAPGEVVVAVELVDRDEVDERIGALTFVTEQLPGWTVTAEPVT